MADRIHVAPPTDGSYDAGSLAREILGEPVLTIEQVLVSGRGYAPPYVHRVRTAQRVVYLKHGPAAKIGGKFALEAWAYERCNSQGVRTPEVVGASTPGDDIEYFATLELRGAALWQKAPSSPQALRSVLRMAGEHLRAMHEIEVDGYGPITSPGTGGDSRWCSFIDVAQSDGLPYFVDRGVLTSDEADDIQRDLEEAATHIPPAGPSKLLHGDVEGDHLFADGDQFTGFIDFEKMLGGDPVYDLARFAWWDAQMLADLVDGYGRDRISDDDLHVRMPAYLMANYLGRRRIDRSVVPTKPFPVEGARRFLDAARNKDFAALVERQR